MLTRVIAGSVGFQRFSLTHDDELDAALILAGYVDVPSDRRYCFQTTYLNERYRDYTSLNASQRFLWVLRNPYSVVYSMVNNWRRFGLNELYDSSRAERPESPSVRGVRAILGLRPPAIERASIAYATKTAQILTIKRLVDPRQLMVLDYDELTIQPGLWLPKVFRFIGAPYEDAYAEGVRDTSVGKANQLTNRQRKLIGAVAGPTYDCCRQLLTRLA